MGFKNLAHCAVELNEETCKVVSWDVVTLTEVKEPSIMKITNVLFDYLDVLSVFLRNSGWYNSGFTVLIEQQMSRNSKCLALQHKLYAYFAMDSRITGANIPIWQCAAKHRYSGTQKNFKGTMSQKYTLRKKQSVSDALDLIKGNSELENIFNCCKKNDDLADSMIQLVVWSKCSNNVKFSLSENASSILRCV